MELLKKLTQTDGVSGEEAAIRELIQQEISAYVDEVTTDALGNLACHKKGTGKKLLFAAHMDEIGIIVTYIGKQGYLRFGAVGGVVVKELPHRRVRFSNGKIGIIGIEGEEEAFYKKPTLQKLYIDLGYGSQEAAQAEVAVGDTAVFTGSFEQDGTVVISKALDDRAGCWILLETAKQLKETKNDLYFVFTVQEEVGLRGAKTAAFGILPDAAIAIDVTDTGDTPGAPAMAVRLGGGAAVKVMDRSILCDSGVRTKMIETAKKNNIPYQLEIMTDGGTDAGAIHVTRSGIKTGGISLATRYVHSPSEMADTNDLKACVDLAVALAQEDWDL